MTPVQAIELQRQVQRLIVAAVGLGHLGVGIAMLVNGSLWLSYSFFGANQLLPWWAWGAWAAASGAMILLPTLHLFGLGATAVWYALWGALIMIGAAVNEGPYYAIPLYTMLIGLHLILFLSEWAISRAK